MAQVKGTQVGGGSNTKPTHTYRGYAAQTPTVKTTGPKAAGADAAAIAAAEAARQAELERQRKIAEYNQLISEAQQLKAELNEKNQVLEFAKDKLKSASQGKNANEIMGSISEVQNNIEVMTGELNAICENAAEKINGLGGKVDTSTSGTKGGSTMTQQGTNTNVYSCDTDALRDVITILNSVSNEFEDITEKASKLPRLQGCENIRNISPQADDTQISVRSIAQSIQKEIEYAERMERENQNIIANAISNIANTGLAFTKGIEKFGESLADAALIFVTAVSDYGSIATGEFQPFEYGKRGISDEAWKNVMGYVANDHVESKYKDFYTNTDKGKWLDENASEVLKSDGTASQIVTGLGEVAGIVLTGGVGGTAAMATAAGVAGFGKATAENWSNAREKVDEGQEWATEETRNKGIAYGTAIGLWEGIQWGVGAAVNNLKIPGVSDLATSAARVGIDTFFNALDTPFRALADSATSDKTLKQAWEDQGGWTSVLINTGIGLAGSIGGEILGNISAKNGNSNIQFAENLDDIENAKPINPHTVFSGNDIQETGILFETKDWKNSGLTIDDVDRMSATDKMDYAKYKVKEFFKERPQLEISDERIKKTFEKITAFDNEDDFVKAYRQKYPMTNDSDQRIKRYGGVHWPDGEIYLNPKASTVDIIHEVSHDLGILKISALNGRGINEAFTERLARKIAGIDYNHRNARGVEVGNGYEENVWILDGIFHKLEMAGFRTDIDEMCYYGSQIEDFKDFLSIVTEKENFFEELVRNMDIADGQGAIKDKQQVNEAIHKLYELDTLLGSKLDTD